MEAKFSVILFLFFWVIISFQLNSNRYDSGSIEGDRQALMDLYAATGGDSWQNNSGWGSGNPDDSWYGVEVDNEGRVVRLDLQDNGLEGQLPASIGNLTKLQYLNIKQNYLSGTLPWKGLGNLTRLTHLLLNGRSVDPEPTIYAHHPGKDLKGSFSDERTNNFSGSMGREVGRLKNLRYLELMGVNSDHTGLTGDIPEELGLLTNLEGLHLSFNSFETLPSSLKELRNLLQIDINYNEFSGSIPSWINQWTKLRFFWLQGNNFSGSIPDLSNLVDLETFIAQKNDLSGEIPGWMFDGTMPKINLVDFAWNEFTGSLPEFGSPNNLKAFLADGNNLTGRIPASVDNIAGIINLSLGWNELEGQIPDLSHMSRLRFFRGSANNFTGSVPMVDTSNEKLNFLHFQDNQLSGEVPAELAKIADLPRIGSGDLNISNNEFSSSDLQPLIKELEKTGKLSILKY
jgi:hypothetical protein